MQESTTITSRSLLTRYETRFEPMNPAPSGTINLAIGRKMKRYNKYFSVKRFYS